MRDHIRVLGYLNIAMGVLGALGGLAILLIFGGLAGIVGIQGDRDSALTGSVFAGIGVALAILALILSLPSILGGWGLLRYRPWARVLMIIISILHLFNVPIGTALGVYGLWVLFSDEGQRLFATGGREVAPPPSYSPPAPPTV